MNRRGFTLLELILTLAITATLLAVAGMAFRTAGPREVDRVGQARRRAIATGTTVSGFSQGTGRFTALPDGSVLTDSTGNFAAGGARDQ